jgi:hypothetical protein
LRWLQGSDSQFHSPERKGRKLRSENELRDKQKDKDIQSLGETHGREAEAEM